MIYRFSNDAPCNFLRTNRDRIFRVSRSQSTRRRYLTDGAIPARSPMTLTICCPAGTMIFALFWSADWAVSRRFNNWEFPTKYLSAASLTSRIASASPSAFKILACRTPSAFLISARFIPSAVVSAAVAKSTAAIFSFSA
jgi:hypothetical protein